MITLAQPGLLRNVLLLVAVMTTRPALALDDQEAVDVAREELSKPGRYPWYDARADQLIARDVQPTEPAPEIRNWVWKQQATPAERSGLGVAVNGLAWILLGLLLVIVIILLVRALLSAKAGQVTVPGQVGLTTDVGRIEKLPFQVQRPSHDLLSEARASYATGNYAKAIVYLFSYQLVHLDRNHLVRLAKGKTNRQYLREVRSQADIVRIVGETMTVFEDVLFGRHTIDRGRFEACWNRLDEFHQCVQKAGTLLVMVALLLVGCSKTTSIDDTYGRRRAADGGNSVNGTRVLARMFEEAGNRVSTARRLSDRLDDADVIVWAPDDFEPPTVEQREFLENWLWEQDGRTLVYIGRDFDAALVYWAEIASRAPREHALEINRRLALKQSEHDAARRSMPQQENCGWFFSRRDGKPRKVRSLRGPWIENIDASQVNISIRGSLDPLVPTSESGEEELEDTIRTATLLQSDDGVLVSRFRRAHWGNSQVIVVTNGSFLLNLPLVNHEHRKLAGRLISACAPSQRVVFLQSGPGGPAISAHERELHHAMKAFTVWPVNGILLHLTMLGIVFCFAVFPIFGRPRELPIEAPSDFGKHIDALGRLLERTADAKYANVQLTLYRQSVRHDQVATPSPHDRSKVTESPA